MKNLLLAPWNDTLAAMDRALDRHGWQALPVLFVTMLASWWLYVPIHELMHAWGCQLAGGQVSRLEIDRQYGAAWLATVFPYVVPGSDYAGRLSGFDTGGSDLVYLITVFFPYLLTLFPGVALLRLASRARTGAAWRLGAALPLALTPFLSLTGDFYEMGSILVSRALASAYPEALVRWRGDDLILIWSGLPPGLGDHIGVAASLLIGTLLAFATYAFGRRLAESLGIGLKAHPEQPDPR